MQFNENRDQRGTEIRMVDVAGALSAMRSLKPTQNTRRERNLFEIGDRLKPETQYGDVASAEPTRLSMKPTEELSARALMPIGRLGSAVTHPGSASEVDRHAASAVVSMKPIKRLRRLA